MIIIGQRQSLSLETKREHIWTEYTITSYWKIHQHEINPNGNSLATENTNRQESTKNVVVRQQLKSSKWHPVWQIPGCQTSAHCNKNSVNKLIKYFYENIVWPFSINYQLLRLSLSNIVLSLAISIKYTYPIMLSLNVKRQKH